MRAFHARKKRAKRFFSSGKVNAMFLFCFFSTSSYFIDDFFTMEGGKKKSLQHILRDLMNIEAIRGAYEVAV